MTFPKKIQKLLLVSVLIWLPFSLQAGWLNPISWFSKNDTQIIETSSKLENKAAKKLLLKAERHEANERGERAQRLYKKLLKKYPKTEEAASVVLKRGLFLESKARNLAAFEAYSLLIHYHPDSSDLGLVINRQFNCAVATMQSDSPKLFGIIKPDALNPEAIPLFLEFTEDYPYHEKTPMAYLHIANIARASQQHDIAIEALKNMINYFSGHPLTEDAYFMMAHIYAEFIKGPEYDLESTREAIRYCEDFIALFSNSDDIGIIVALYERMINTLAQNRLHLGDYYYFNKRDAVAALIFYNEVLSTAPDSEAATEAQKRIEAIDKGLKPATGTNLIKRLLFIR